MIFNLLLVGCGGFAGSVLRYLVSGHVQMWSRSSSFPYGTFAVNFFGCLLIGFLSQLMESRGFFSERSRFFVFVGMLGGFTTFSTFSNESMDLLRDKDILSASMNIMLQIALGLFAVWFGRASAHLIWR